MTDADVSLQQLQQLIAAEVAAALAAARARG